MLYILKITYFITRGLDWTSPKLNKIHNEWPQRAKKTVQPLGHSSFIRMSGGSQYLTKSQFRDNLGLMGLDTVYFLSDRIFSILDDNKDDRVPLWLSLDKVWRVRVLLW